MAHRRFPLVLCPCKILVTYHIPIRQVFCRGHPTFLRLFFPCRRVAEPRSPYAGYQGSYAGPAPVAPRAYAGYPGPTPATYAEATPVTGRGRVVARRRIGPVGPVGYDDSDYGYAPSYPAPAPAYVASPLS